MKKVDVLDNTIVFVNGQFMSGREATVSLFDSGLLYGDGIFDTLCARNGYLFKPDQHLNRLFRSANGVRMEIPYSRQEVKRAILDVAARNMLRDAYLKCVITRGVKYPPTMDPRGRKSNLYIFGLPYINLAEKAKDGALRTKISAVRRTPVEALDPRIKSLDYQNLVLAKFDAFDAGVDEAILCDIAGNIAEGPGYNIFMVCNGRLVTPIGSVLEGVTRETVLEIAARHDIPCLERSFSPFELCNADEAFFSTTGGGILPIVEVDKRRIGDGTIGPTTRRIRDAYADLLESGTDSVKIDYPDV